MKRIISIIMMVTAALAMRAQNVTDLVISEVMVDNQTSVTDDFGRHSAWVELLNSSQGTVNFGGCFWTDDLGNLTKSPILKGDNRTKLGPRQLTLFHEGGDGITGTFYLNFALRPGTTLYLVSNNGRTIIDSISIPADMPQGKSMSKFARDAKGMLFDPEELSDPSPMVLNGAGMNKSRAESIKETDPHGWTLTVTCVTVVFSALVILFIIYSLLGKIFTGGFKIRRKKPAGSIEPEVAAAIAMALEAECSSEAEAAIAMALHMYLSEDAHDQESFVLTIRPHISGWNDKSLTTRKTPRL